MFREKLRALVSAFIQLDDVQLSALEKHYSFLQRWNRVMNLTRIEAFDDVLERHYGESLFLASRLPWAPLRIVDVGSGAGFPGFPIAVVRRDCTVTLVESKRRKAAFLQEASRGVPNIRVWAGRAEDLERDAFDAMVARGVRWKELRTLGLAPVAMVLGGADVPGERVALPWGKARYLATVQLA